VRQIFPVPAGGSEIGPDAADALARLYAYPEPEAVARPWVRAVMIASADGAAALDGRSGGLSGAADRLVFSVLRSLADVILVGAGTARAERYRPVLESQTWPQLRAGRAPTPPIAVLTRTLDLDPDSGLLATAPGLARTIVLTTQAAPAARRAAAAGHAEVIVAGGDTVTATAAVAALAGRGYRRILVEGGPGLLGQVTAEYLLDELCLTYSPVLAGGSAARIIAGPPAQARPPAQATPAGLDLAHVLEDEGYLLCRYLRREDTA
jgi:riboflavin biosynthesis pyrimidine reductase